MKIYCASKAHRAERDLWCALRGCGLPIISTWIDSEINTTDREVSPSAWGEHWVKCLSEVSSADLVIFYAPEGFTQCGSLIEIGAALQAGAQVYVISDYTWTIAHHQQCRIFKTLEDAVIAVKARSQGEEARARAIADLHRVAQQP